MRKVRLAFGIIGIMFSVTFCSTSNTVKETKESSRWSGGQGKMGWADAMEKCKSVGMRLPKAQEFAVAQASGETKSWEQKGYWTSEDVSENFAYSFNILDRSIIGTEKTFQWRVICIR